MPREIYIQIPFRVSVQEEAQVLDKISGATKQCEIVWDSEM